jgi:hypothetical protein
MSLHQETAYAVIANDDRPVLADSRRAVISLTLFWAIAFGSHQLTRWLFAHAVGHRSLFSVLLPEAAFFATFIPSMVIVGKQQRKKQAQRKLPRPG